MKTAEEHLLIFERHFSPEKRCRPPLRWGIMPSAYFSAPLPRGLVEGASDGRYPQRSRPSKQRSKNRQMASALRVAEITGQRPQSLWLRGVARGPAVLASRFACPAVASHPLRQPTAGMRPRSRLARGAFFPQRSLCDLISASLASASHGLTRNFPAFDPVFFSAALRLCGKL
jgi:hypothetical protein